MTSPGASSASAMGSLGTPMRTVIINFRGSVTGLADTTQHMTNMIGGVASKAIDIGKALTSALGGNFKPLMGQVTGAVASFAKYLFIIPGFLLALVNPSSVATMAMANFSQAISAASPAEFVAATRNMAPAMKDAVMSVRLLEPQLKNLYGIIQQGFWLGFSQDVSDLSRVYFPILGSGLGTIGSALGSLREDLVQLLLKPQVVAAIQGWMTAFGTFITSLGPLVTNMMPTLISLFNSFSSILINFVVPALSVVAGWFAKIMAWIAPILSGIASIFSGVRSAAGGLTSGSSSTGGSSGGSTGGGGVGGFFSGIISGIAGFFGHLFGRAGGGAVLGGQSYLVGERGPEILRLGGNQAGMMTPNSGGTGDTHVTVKIGETELRTLVQTEVNYMMSGVALAARTGRGDLH